MVGKYKGLAFIISVLDRIFDQLDPSATSGELMLGPSSRGTPRAPVLDMVMNKNSHYRQKSFLVFPQRFSDDHHEKNRCRSTVIITAFVGYT